jgi:NADPH:quinone reductase-like Zn-dependent oxidoreductase
MQILRWLSWAGYQLDAGLFNHQEASQQVLALAKTESSSNIQPRNYAAFLSSEDAQIAVAETPFPKCGAEELIVKNHVIAVNPVDWKIQDAGHSGRFNLTYPIVLGQDLAGEVVEVGSSLQNEFQAGQRVMAHASGLGNGNTYGAFQLYTVVKVAAASLIPDQISFSEAAVLPLSISTAAAGLFMKSTLGLKYPTTESSHARASGNSPTLLLWGGSSSVGSSVIQLASAAGYTVITTASSAHFEYCKELGAAHVLDYHDSDVVSALIALLKGKDLVGAYDAIGSDETVHQCATILHALGGGTITSVGAAPDDLPADVAVTRISSGNIFALEPEIGKAVWGEYVPWALKSGGLVPNPKALVVGKGLDNVQKGLDRQKQGVSARKVEVVLV